MTLRLLNPDGSPPPAGVNAWFGSGTVGQGVDYRMALIHNTHASMSVTGGKLSLRPDPGGGGFAIAVLDGTARNYGYSYGSPNPASGSYSSPTDAATGLVLPTLAPNQVVLIGIRRDLTTGSAAHPEANVLRVDATAPAGYT